MASDKYNIELLPPSFSGFSPKKPASEQIAVLMSGGVDSSVTAHLLREDGWEVLGITMKIPVTCTTTGRGCCGADAAFVCAELDIPHYFVDVTDAFRQLIIDPFRESYSKGHTPNPCIDCNTFLKFSLVWDFLQATFGIGHLATGHYARIERRADRALLSRANDKAKDQSYFLYGVAAERLDKLILPLGELGKQQVRSVAAGLNLSIADKPESMELCFAGEGDYRAALRDTDADKCGDVTDMQGNIIATHKGIANYTLGQRQGIGFAGGKPLYVGMIDAETNTIALGTRDQVSSCIVGANQVNILMPEQLVGDRPLLGKIRSYGDPKPCRIVDVGELDMTVEFDEPQFAPCPGQRLVLYDGEDNLVAGGTIVQERGQTKPIT
ncbi:MAG: tRNA 2-thiouridine(34) synthase MnmA [Phycisphaerales bacterium]|nr:MAG: tRNA 2-thiouridine(34) synthase MnmA [Phycisphaerales bacterium]